MQVHGGRGMMRGAVGMVVAGLHHGAGGSRRRRSGRRVVVVTQHCRPRRRGEPSRMIQFDGSSHTLHELATDEHCTAAGLTTSPSPGHGTRTSRTRMALWARVAAGADTRPLIARMAYVEWAKELRRRSAGRATHAAGGPPRKLLPLAAAEGPHVAGMLCIHLCPRTDTYLRLWHAVTPLPTCHLRAVWLRAPQTLRSRHRVRVPNR